MMWFRIPKEAVTEPIVGTHRDWKEQLAEEGRHQCVYCAIAEAAFGGFRNFHVEHYRPKSIFPDLIDEYANVFYCCAICNSFKGGDWPGEPQEDGSAPAYYDPSQVDLSDVFEVAPDSLRVSAHSVAGEYMLERLYLNRPQLVLERRWHALHARAMELLIWTMAFVRERPPEDTIGREACRLARMVMELLGSLNRARPYRPEDLRRN